jgi:LysM repeat protein
MRTFFYNPTSKVRFIALVSIILLTNTIYSQSTQILPPRAQIEILPTSNTNVEFTITNAETNSSDVAAFFNVKPSKVSNLPAKSSKYKVSIPKSSLLQKPSISKTKAVNPYCQLMHTVVKGETLFSISKKVGKSVDEIQFLNDMKANEIKVGQKILIGYVQVFPKADTKAVTQKAPIAKTAPVKVDTKDKAIKTSEVAKKEKSDVLIKKETSNSKSSPQIDIKSKEELAPTIEPVHVPKIVTRNVIASWDKKAPISTNMYVLHNEAEVGSTIQIFFPMLKRKVKAKVLGKIPTGTYTDDIALFISPAVANELGILDNKANVVVSYISSKGE